MRCLHACKTRDAMQMNPLRNERASRHFDSCLWITRTSSIIRTSDLEKSSSTRAQFCPFSNHNRNKYFPELSET